MDPFSNPVTAWRWWRNVAEGRPCSYLVWIGASIVERTSGVPGRRGRPPKKLQPASVPAAELRTTPYLHSPKREALRKLLQHVRGQAA